MDNPLFALLAELKQQNIIKLEDDKLLRLLAMTGRTISQIISDVFHIDIAAISAPTSQDRIVDGLERFEQDKKIVQAFADSLTAKLSDGKLVLFVDELDRCDADYAVRFLEVINLLFKSPNVIFVVGVNLSQLDAAIQQRYGWDAEAYRRRFIDLVLNVPPNASDSLKQYFDKVLSRLGLQDQPYRALDFIRDSLLGRPDESMNSTAAAALAADASLRDLQQFANQWLIFNRRIDDIVSMGGGDKDDVSEIGTVLLLAKHLAPNKYHGMLEGSVTDAEVLDSLNQALKSRFDIYTSPMLATLQAALSLCVIVAGMPDRNYDIKMLLHRGELRDKRRSTILMNKSQDDSRRSLYEQLIDSPYKNRLHDMQQLNFQQLDGIVSALEGCQSGALGHLRGI